MGTIYQSSHTFRLFQKHPSFLDGLASLVDMSPNASRYHQNKSGEEADSEALRADWYAIGADLWQAVRQYERKRK